MPRVWYWRRSRQIACLCSLPPATAPAAAHFNAGAEVGKYYADLFGLARARLSRIGVESVYGGGVCTVGNPQTCFSHRRDNGQSGRMAALIWRD